MGYKFSWQASLASFSPYFILFNCDFELPTSICHDIMVVMNLNDLTKWFWACEQKTTLFKCVMPMAMENLTIVQHWDTLQYAPICGNGYWPQIRRFKPRDFVYL
jgi:hypothetical protein